MTFKLNLSGDIGESFWGYSLERLHFDLRELQPGDPLEIYMNSRGGDVNEALAIKADLESRANPIIIHVTGMAASAATLITSITKARVIMHTGSMMVIHNPWTIAMGNQKEMQKTADRLEKRADGMAAIYAAKTGLGLEEIHQIMDAETWYSADEAIEKGFADELMESDPVEVTPSGDDDGAFIIAGLRTDLTKFKHTSEKLKIKGEFKNMPNPKKPVTGEPKSQATTQGAQSSEPIEAKVEKPVFASADDLAKAYPELAAQLVEHGKQIERERMKSLDALANASNRAFIEKAKYETLSDAATCCYEIVKAQNERGEQALTAIREDAQALTGVTVAQDGALTDEAADRAALVKTIAANFKKE